LIYRNGKKLLFLVLLPFVLVACGIDDEPYLSPVEASSVVVTTNTGARAIVAIDGSESLYSPSFLLYYKIYISTANELSAISPDVMSRINSTLSTDYNGILSYTTLNTTNRPVFTPTIFSSRNFYTMVVGSSETFSTTGELRINFENQNNASLPSASVGGGPALTLYRSTGGGSFVPLPENDLRFRNFTELRNTQNRDVAQGSGGDFSYCAVYIVKRGVNPNTLTAIYSAPTFLAVFRLPDRY
jgi:hypothetical protein